MSSNHDSLVASLGETERELVQARLDLAVGRLENTAQIGVLRKKYARLSTKLRAEEIAGGLPKGSLAAKARIAPMGVTTSEVGGEPKGGFLKGIVDRLSGSNE